MVQIPGLFIQAGWFLPCLAFLMFAVMGLCSSLFLSRSITKIVGNSDLSKRVEYILLLQQLLPRWLYLAGVFSFCCVFISMNVSNIVVSAQVMDDILLVAARKTCALILYPASLGPTMCVSADDDAIIDDSPFGDDVYPISFGYLIVAVLTLPLSYVNLDNNVIFQIGGVALIIICVVTWVANFCAMGLVTPIPTFAGEGGDYSNVLSTVLFNYGFVTTVPSWLNEKSPSVGAARTLTVAVCLSTALFLLLGIFGALSPLNVGSSTGLLGLLVSSGTPGVWTISKVGVYVFPAANLMTSIPVFSVVIRYNLVNSGLLRPLFANLASIGTPWILSLPFYAGNQLSLVVNWSSALFFAIVNFLFPTYLYWKQRQIYQRAAFDKPEDWTQLAEPSRCCTSEVEEYLPKGINTTLLLSGDHGLQAPMLAQVGDDDDEEEAEKGVAEDIRPTPGWFRAYVPDVVVCKILFGLGVIIAGMSLGMQIFDPQS